MNLTTRTNLVAVVLACLALAGVVGTATAQGIPFSVLTITNPTPANFDGFGSSVAAVGTDKVLIGAYSDDTGAPGAGAAYLFSINGEILTTFTNPTPASDDLFSSAVAAVGTNLVLIGAPLDDTGATNAGAAYLFNINGTLLNTFTNPTPESDDNFGEAVAAVGTDKVLIGARGDNTGFPGAGAAYLYSTNGTLITTFTNPARASYEFFGSAVAAMDGDKVLIGAFNHHTGAVTAGAAYLFSTDGTLLTTFTNPTPAAGDKFGYPVAAVGTDKVLIGASGDDSGADEDVGVAYLFSTNGALLTTFNNPTPRVTDYFGYAVAAVGTNKVLIGASGDNLGATAAGAAYLFSTDGTLLTTFTNPTPASEDNFGIVVAAMGTDKVLIAAFADDTGATNAGATYFFTLGYPPLNITGAATNYSVTWSTIEPGLILQQTEALAAPTAWADVVGVPAKFGPTNIFSLTVPPESTKRFFKLRRP